MSQETIEKLRGNLDWVTPVEGCRLIADELDSQDAHLAALETRLAEREQDLARLRREMDALLTAFRTTPVQGPTRFLALACGEAILEAAESKP